MFINDLTDLDCEACGEAVDVLAVDFEATLPLLCGRCLLHLLENGPDVPVLAAAA